MTIHSLLVVVFTSHCVSMCFTAGILDFSNIQESVMEGEVLEVCVALESAVLNRELPFEITVVPSTATGEVLIKPNSYRVIDIPWLLVVQRYGANNSTAI